MAIAVVVIGCISSVAVGFGLGRLKPQGPEHPAEWDPRVADIAGWVQMERALDFDHPVYVDFLSAEEYSEFVRSDEATAGSDEDDAKEAATAESEGLEDLVGWYRSLGLLDGEHDLAAAFDEMYANGSLAIYSPKTDRVTVRGTKMTTAIKVTLAHELTHALQDQHFDLGRLETFSGVKQEAFRAVVEGDADRIEQIYLEKELTDEERLVYEKESEDAAAVAEVSMAETVPDIILTGFGAAYALGDAFVEVLDQAGGNAAIDQALREPVETDEQLFDPFSDLDNEAPTAIEAPEAAKGAEVLEEGEFGVTTLYVLLTSRIDPQEALAAIDGWGGDASLISRRDGKICVDLVIEGEDAAATARLGDVLTRWSDATPGGHDRVAVTADEVRVATCDPGAEADLKVSPDVGRFLALPQIRSFLAAGHMERGRSRTEAKCFAGAVTVGMDFDRLDTDEAYSESPEFKQLVADSQGLCLE